MLQIETRHIKRGFIATVMLLFVFSGFAQLKKANQLFDAMQYTKAIPLYQKVLDKGVDSVAVKNIAESYRRTNDLKAAEVYYKQATQLYPEDKEIQLTYAQLLKSNSKLDQAKEVFIVYASKNPLDAMSQKYVLSCDQIKSWTVEIPNFEAGIEEGINTASSEFSAVPFENGVAFVTDRFVDHVEGFETGTEEPYLKIAYSEQQEDSAFKKVKPIKSFNNHYHNGPISFNNSQTLAIFTRVGVAKKQEKDFVNKPQLYTSKKEGNSWSKPEPFEHNNIKYSYAHSSLSADESMMFFASDMKGGYGGFDIYVSKKEGEGWSLPQNLGEKVNTFGNEIFPFAYSNDTLYFSSNTHVGYGGQDVFYTTYQNNEWTAPMNLKNQVNSPKDDFGIVFKDKKHGFFSSNRDGGQGKDDIYNFTLVRELKERTSVSGIFLYSELDPAAGAEISLLDEDGNVMMVTQSNEKGEFVFDDLESDRNYLFMVNEEDPNLSMQSKIYLTNEKGEKIVALNQPGPGLFKFRTLPPDEIAALPTLDEEDIELSFVDIFGQLYDKLPGDYSNGLEVLLIDDTGEILYTTIADTLGNFAFENVLPLSDYKIILKPDTTVNLMFTDGEGNKVRDAERNEEGEYDYKKQQFLASSNVFGRVYDKLPGDFGQKMEVYLVDDEGNIMYTTTTDENGDFVFENLPLDQNYIVKFNEEDGDYKLLMLDEEKGEGNLAMQNAEGEYVIEPEEENALDFFGRIYQKLPGDFSEGMEVFLVDDDGNVIYKTITDENGDFVFENLPPDHQYIVKIAEEDTDFKLLMLDEQGDPEEMAQLDKEGNYVLEPETESAQDFFGRIYQKLPGDFNKEMEVYLVDDDGNIVYTAITDENGDFVFENLPADHNYKLKLQDSEEELSMVVLDEFGQVVSKAEAAEDGSLELEEATSENSLFGNIYQKLPGDFSQGMEVYLLDDNGEVIYTAITDENGDFVFENLPPDHNYRIRLKDDEDAVNMIVLNDFGEMEQLTADGMGEFDINEKPKRDVYGNCYITLPGDLSKSLNVSLLDEKGIVIYSTTTDTHGNFEFKNLPIAANYKLKLDDVNDNINMIVMNEAGEMIASAENLGDGLYAVEEEIASMYGRVFNKLPGDFGQQMEVYLVDDNGDIIYTAITDENGDFIFENLPPDHNYTIKFKEDLADANIIILDEFGNKVKEVDKQENGEYAFIQEEETASIFGKAYKKLPGDFGQQMEVYLVDDNGDIIYTAITNENGDFVFENLPKDQNYVIRFNVEDAEMKLIVLDEKGNEVDDLAMTDSGDFSYEYLTAKNEFISLLTFDDAVIKIREDDKFIMFNVYFEYDSYKLQKSSYTELNKIALILNKNPHVGVEIKGYTDSKGEISYNQKLSEKRARSVGFYLNKKGIDLNRLMPTGLGESNPIAANELPNGEDNPEGRKKNRRTEVNIIRIK